MDKVIKHARSFIRDDMITLSVADGGSYTVQKAILRRLSPYFDKALTGQFMEAQKKALVLPGSHTSDVQFLLYWMEHKTLPDFRKACEDVSKSQVAEEEKSNSIEDIQIKLVHLWISADYWLMPKLQNAAMLALVPSMFEHTAKAKAIQIAWEDAARDSQITALLLTRCVMDGSRNRDGLSYTEEEFDELGSLPGFFKAYAAQMPDWCNSCGNKELYLGFLEDEEKKYLVNEDEVDERPR